MTVTVQYLENKIKTFNEYLHYHKKGNHFEYAQNKNRRDYLVEKLIEAEKNDLTKISIDTDQDTWPIENDTLDIREHEFNFKK